MQIRTEWGVLWAFMCLCFKVRCNVESKTMGVNFPFSATLTRCVLRTGLLSSVPGSFKHACFSNITYWWLKKYWFTDLHRSSKCWHVHYKYWQLTFVNFTIYLIGKVCKDWEAGKLRMADTSFPGFESLLESSDCIIGNKYCQLFSLKWQTHFIHFWENVAKYSTVCQSFFRIEWSCMKKAISFLHNSAEFTSAFPGDNHRASIRSKHTVCRFLFWSKVFLTRTDPPQPPTIWRLDEYVLIWAKVKVLVIQCPALFYPVDHSPAPLSMAFSRQEYWSG